MISGKTLQKSAVTCLAWPSSQANYVVGLADGKVYCKPINIGVHYITTNASIKVCVSNVLPF